MSNQLTRDRIRLMIILLWALLVCSAYYIQFWRLIHGDPNAYFSAFKGPWQWQLTTMMEALIRAARAVAGAGVILFDAYLIGLATTRLLRWRFGNWREAVPFQLSIGLGAISYVSVALAVAGIYRVRTVRVLLACVLAVGILGLTWYFVRRRSAEPLRLPGMRWSAFSSGSETLWQLVSLVAVAVALIGALAPETEWDALWYHLWLPKLWLAAGRPVDVITEQNSLYPLTWELIFGAGLATGGPIAAKLLHFATLPLTAIVVFEFTKRFFPSASAWLSAAIFLTVPTIMWESTTAYVDLAMTFHTALALFALFRYSERHGGQWLTLSSLNFGLAAATKYLGLIVGALAAAGLVFYLWSQGRRNFWLTLRPAMILGFVCLLFPIPWYLRSWRASGNPVFPQLVRVFGAKPDDRWNDSATINFENFLAHYGRPRTISNLVALPWDVTTHPAVYAGSLGPVFLIFLPALALFHGRVKAVPWLFGFTILYLVVWASPLSSFQLRFVTAATPALALLASEAYRRLNFAVLRSAGLLRRVALPTCMAILLSMNLPFFTSLHETDQPRQWLSALLFEIPAAVVFGAETERGYLSRRLRTYTAWEYINRSLPQSALILSMVDGDNFYRERNSINDSIPARKALAGLTDGHEAQSIQALRGLGITHILFDRKMLSDTSVAVAGPAVVQRWFAPEFETNCCILYRIR